MVVGGKRVLLAFALLVWTVVVFCRLGSAHYVLFWGLGAASVFLLNVRRPILLGFAGFGVMATGVLLYQMSTESRSVHVGLAVPPALAEAAICIGLCLALPWLCGALSRTPRWAARLFTFLASFSYSLYLVHMPVIVFLEKGVPNATALNAHTLGIFGFRVAACLAVAFLFSLLFECQTPRLRRFIRLRTQGLKPVREVAP